MGAPNGCGNAGNCLGLKLADTTANSRCYALPELCLVRPEGLDAPPEPPAHRGHSFVRFRYAASPLLNRRRSLGDAPDCAGGDPRSSKCHPAVQREGPRHE